MLMRTTLAFLLAVPLWAQHPLSLREAVRLAIRENKAIAGTTAGVRASEARIAQARGGTAQGQLRRVLRAQQQPGLRLQFPADAAPVRR